MGNYVKFDSTGYYNALKREVMANLSLLEKDIYASIHRRLDSLQMRDLDAKYKGAILSSLKVLTKKMADYVVITAKMGGGKQSFRAVYYEFGTGLSMIKQASWNVYPQWNPARPQAFKAPIYQRPRGVWFDQGGNRHVSKTKGVPKKLPNKPGLFGEEVKAQTPFTDGLRENLGKLDEYISNAVKSVPIGAYIRIRSIRK